MFINNNIKIYKNGSVKKKLYNEYFLFFLFYVSGCYAMKYLQQQKIKIPFFFHFLF
jgi:hypothetical protein